MTFFSTNPSAKLLRAKHSAHVIFFLHEHFKVAGNMATPHATLLLQLNQYLEQRHETDPDILQDRAETYLTQWSTGDTRWLQRHYDAEHAEPVYQLTPHTEDVLKFLTDVLDHTIGFVGTESRLTRIIETLSDIVVRGSSDPDRRLQYLSREQRRIEQEIQSIKSGEAVSTHSPTAIRERFADAVSDLKSLQGDFRAVEESFKSITRDVQKQQTESVDSRGKILGFALDAEDRLKEDDQGASFQAFVQLVLSDSQQDEVERLIAQLDEIAELTEQWEGKRHLKGMINSLAAEAEKVLRTTRRLSATLRRLLDSRASTIRLRLATVLREIQGAAVSHAECPPDVGLDVFTDLDLLNLHQRTFWESPVDFPDFELSNEDPDEDDRVVAFRQFAEMPHLNWGGMREKIAGVLQSAERTTLPELLRAYPPTAGSIEVLGYIQLAHDDGHEVDEGHPEVVSIGDIDDDEDPKSYEIPRVVFLSERLRSLRSHLAAGSVEP